MGTENELTLRSMEDETEVSYCEADFDQTVGSSVIKKKRKGGEEYPRFDP